LGSFCCRRARNTAGDIRTKPRAAAVAFRDGFRRHVNHGHFAAFPEIVSFAYALEHCGARHAAPYI